ncbi:hypothetical protein Mapa_007358 [Marchantia paleacea]|nr:hypothetical protein Mapa_007358 [Marchantia paleacea]
MVNVGSCVFQITVKGINATYLASHNSEVFRGLRLNINWRANIDTGNTLPKRKPLLPVQHGIPNSNRILALQTLPEHDPRLLPTIGRAYKASP